MAHLIIENVRADDPAFLYLNLHPGEEIKIIIRHHWAGFLGILALTTAMALVPIVFIALALTLPSHPFENIIPLIVLFISGFFLFLQTFLFGSWINYYYDIVFITNQRLLNVDQRGLLSRETSELSLRQIQNVSADVDGFLQTAFNYGKLVVETAGAGTGEDVHRPGLEGYFTIDDLPDPNRLARIIIELHHAADLEDQL